MMPIVFWASFAPWPRLNAAADTSCPRRKFRLSRSTRCDRWMSHMIVTRDDDTQGQADQGREDDEDADLAQALGLEHVKARPGHRATGHAADQRMRRARREAQVERDEVPADGADETGEDHAHREHAGGRVDHVVGDRRGHLGAEHGEGDEVEEGRPDDGVLRPEHPGGDDGGDRVGRVVEAVREVESERQDDDERPLPTVMA